MKIIPLAHYSYCCYYLLCTALHSYLRVVTLILSIGTCNCTPEPSLDTEDREYQFRVQLSAASSCHCVDVTNVNEALRNVFQTTNIITKWCTKDFDIINNSLLCATENKTSTFLSPLLNANTAADQCSNNNMYADQNTTDIAVAYNHTVFSSCSQSHCIPFMAVNKSLM